MSLPRRSGSNDILVWHQEVTVDSDPALVAISMHPHNCEDDDDEHDDDRGAGVVLLCQVATAQDFFTGFITLRELKNIESPQDAASGSGTLTSQSSIHDDDDDLGPKILGLPIPMQNLLRLLETACSGSAATPFSQQQQGEQPPPLTLGFVKTTTTNDNTTTTTPTPTVLRVSIKQRLSSGIVRTLFHTTLMRVVPKDDPQPDGNNNNNNHLLQLSLRLRQRQTTLIRQVQTWQQRYTQLEQAQKEWQTTAEQLEGQWDQEKTQLLQNFCDLYTAKQNDSRRQYQELQQQMQTLQHELEQARAALSSSSSNRTSPPRGTTATVKPLPEVFQTIPGDADHERLFDPEMVSCLAAGRRVRTTTVPPNQQPSASNTTTTTTTRKRRFNPTLGTMEYMDVDAALEDVEGEDEDVDNTTRNTNPTTNGQDPSSTSAPPPQPAPPATKKAKSNKATARSSKQNNNNNNNQDEDSSTASDNSLFDAKMHGDILSQLAKL